jgi:hypothetical protein
VRRTPLTGRRVRLLELFGGVGFLIVAVAKMLGPDIYPAGDYRATLAFKAVIGLIGLSLGVVLLTHAIAGELRDRRGG